MDDDLDADQHTHSLRYWISPVLGDVVCAIASEQNLAGNQDNCLSLRRDRPLGRWSSAKLTTRDTAPGSGRCSNIS